MLRRIFQSKYIQLLYFRLLVATHAELCTDGLLPVMVEVEYFQCRLNLHSYEYTGN